MKQALAISLLVFLSGCIPNKYVVVYQSYPSGAVVSEGDKVWGRAPVSLTYMNPDRRWNQIINGVTCTWASGSVSDTGRVTIDLSKGGIFYVGCNRSMAEPGIEVDLEVSDKQSQQAQVLQQLNSQQSLQRRQTEAAEGTLMFQSLEYLNLSPLQK